MAFDRIVGYTFEADTWCVECTLKHFAATVALLDPIAKQEPYVDKHGLPYNTVDGEGNTVWAIFPFHEFDYQPTCSRCFKDIDAVGLDAGR